MSRWMGLGIVVFAVLGIGCQEETDGSRAALVFDQMSGRETAYHSAVSTLPDAITIQTETSDYASDMHDLLDSMRQACLEMMHGDSMMGHHDMADMTDVMDRMRNGIDDYDSSIHGMDSMDEMRTACEEHHAAMGGLLDEMGPMVDDDMKCCGS